MKYNRLEVLSCTHAVVEYDFITVSGKLTLCNFELVNVSALSCIVVCNMYVSEAVLES